MSEMGAPGPTPPQVMLRFANGYPFAMAATFNGALKNPQRGAARMSPQVKAVVVPAAGCGGGGGEGRIGIVFGMGAWGACYTPTSQPVPSCCTIVAKLLIAERGAMETLAERWARLGGAVLGQPPERAALWARVVAAAEAAHGSQARNDGQPFLAHALDVAEILAEWGAEPLVVMGGLLHDAAPHGRLSEAALEAQLDHAELSALLRLTTQLAAQVATVPHARESSRLQRLFDVMVRDVRAVLIRCANHLANLLDLDTLRGDARQRLLLNSDEVYMPLMERLGLWRVRTEVEDRLFRARMAERHARLSRWSAAWQSERAADTAAWQGEVEAALRAHGLGPERASVEIAFRSPAAILRHHLASRPADADDFGTLDARHAFVTLVHTATVADGYLALGAVHECGAPGAATFRDFFAQPKANGYAGLHTSVVARGVPHRLHLQTRALARLARSGILLPEAYRCWRDGTLPAAWQPAEQRALSHFVGSLRRARGDRLLLLTPRGDVVPMADGATVLDFAYEIHTDVGRQTGSALVNDQPVPLDHALRSGDVVEIRKDLGREWPDERWLEWVRTTKARNAITVQLRQRPENRGRFRLDRELRQRGRTLEPYQARLATLADEMGSTVAELFRGVARGTLQAHEIVDRLLFLTPPARATFHRVEPTVETAARFPLWEPSLLVAVPCCAPAPGESIVGYHAGRAIELHRDGCPNLLEDARRVGLCWGSERVAARRRDFTLRAVNRKGLLNDLTQLMRGASVDIVSLEGRRQGEMDEVRFTLEVTNDLELAHLLDSIRRLRSVNHVTVDGEEAGAALGHLRRSLAPPQPIPSPFSPGRPAVGEGRFWGRAAERLAIETHLSGDRPGSLLVRGPRRIGKTSLLQHLGESRAIRERYRPVYVDLQAAAHSDAPQVFRHIARRLDSALGGAERVPVPTAADFAHDPAATFGGFLASLADAHRHAQKRVLLALDEFGTLVDAVRAGALDGRIFHMLRSVMQHNPLVTVLLSTSDDVVELLDEEGVLGLLNVTQEVRLNPLDAEAAQRMIQEPLRGRVYFEPNAVDALLDATDAHPFFLQILGATLVSLLNQERRTSVFASDIEALASRHIHQHGAEFRHLWERHRPTHHAVLRALCAAPAARAAAPLALADVLRRLRATEPALDADEVHAALDHLARRDTLARALHADGTPRYHVRVPLFARWFAATFPMAQVERMKDEG